MGLARVLFGGEFGNWMDTEDNRRRISTLRAQLRNKRSVDRRQDERLLALERDNEVLKLCLASLARALAERGVVAADVLADYGALIDEEPPDA